MHRFRVVMYVWAMSVPSCQASAAVFLWSARLRSAKFEVRRRDAILPRNSTRSPYTLRMYKSGYVALPSQRGRTAGHLATRPSFRRSFVCRRRTSAFIDASRPPLAFLIFIHRVVRTRGITLALYCGGALEML
ncbi:hypothetical protein EDD17DRAFT_462304 [Pisolithus thermaeus]|nr:hypothetical protein EDD17DRAFT_462304 [Pisolithus thermaeus]